ncbi:MAG: MFS transporter [Candidatus Kapaibacteriota bacterium]
MMLDKNSFAFIWHAFWLSLAETFTDKNSVLPGLILLAGGTQTDIGTLTAIMIGVPLISQIIFASLLLKKPFKKKYLLIGIYLRVTAFLGVALSIYFLKEFTPQLFILIVFFWMALFSISGAFAGISYNDLLGKSIESTKRKKFFVIKQFTTSFGILISAFVLKKMLVGFSYPDNYKYAFTLAGILLFIGTFGYYFVKERSTIVDENEISFIKIIKSIPFQLAQNKNLKYLVIIANLIGLTITITPFYVAYARKLFVLNNELISNFLFYQIIGMIFSNLFWHYLIKRIAFKGMIKISVLLYSIVPVSALILSQLNSVEIFPLLFLLVGAAISANRIAIDGALIEISDDSNRVLFTGIFGSLNIVSVIFPLLISFIIAEFSYQIVFTIFPLITLTAYYFIRKMDCLAYLTERKKAN